MKRLFPILSVLFFTACSLATPAITPTPIVITAVTTPTAIPATATVAAAPSYPAPTQINIAAVYEPFERGFMIYLSDRKQIWVFIRPTLANTTTNLPVNFGQWLAYADTFKDGEPETDPTFAAPTRLLQPKRGFGKVWRENAPVRVGIGWALDWEVPYNASLTTYPIGAIEGGKFNHKFSFHIITLLDGSSVHVNEATYMWSKQ
ncbi:MAG: hypothetical protein HZC38_12645 [Chloroflexi bacterium]|nr:hypothetical protein [Chloroflexota bacterium]